MAEERITKKPKILLIDDEVAILQALGFYLNQEGYSVDALAKFHNYIYELRSPHLPDIIILDILLNEENGAKIAKELKKNSRTRHIPIILISALPEGQKMAKESKADAFLAKPFDLEDLNETIDRLLQARKK